MGGFHEGVPASLSPGEAALLMGPSFESALDAACVDLQSPDTGSVAQLVVTFVDSVADRVEVWNRYADSYPARVALVDVKASARGEARTRGDGSGPRADAYNWEVPDTVEVSVETVSSPGNLTRLGVSVTERLDELSAEGYDTLVVCFDSVSTLLQYTSRRETFEFIHVLSDRCRAADVISHFHLEPAAHDDEIVATLRTMFDVVCHYQDGEWHVQSD